MILDDIVKYKKEFNQESQKINSFAALQAKAEAMPREKCFLNALKNSASGLIAEIKKASPSKGLIRPNFSVEEIAKAYQKSLAACVSCLTDEKYFQGSASIFKEARKILQKPMLRKDFTVDAYNVYEAKEMGANAILLIATILEDSQMQDYYQLANELGLDTLFEVHDERELMRVLPLNPEIVGINNRNLQTFETSLQTSLNLIPKIPKNVYIISESALFNRQDILALEEVGANGFLMGEVFMREQDITQKISEIFNQI